MSPKTIRLYTAAELKAKHPEGFDSAFHWYQDHETEIPWADETMESLKGLFKATSGITLRDYEIGAYCYSSIKAEFDQDEAADLTGARAMAWLENNLYSRLRIRTNHRASGYAKPRIDEPLGNLRYNQSYRSCGNPVRPYTIGMIPPCPFTGYCADDDFIDALNEAVRHGDTLREAFQGLADTARHLLESELDYNQSEEAFLDTASANDWQFTKAGQYIR